jgi:F-type H+-transporting ATPase subunit a
VIPVLADLLPNVNELFEYKGFFGQHEWYEFNKTAALAFVSTLICIGLFYFGSRKKAMVPGGLQNVAELGYETVEQQIAVEVMGPENGKKWAPFLSTLFFWIFFINIWSTVPFIYFPATSRIAIPIYLALQTWVIFIFVGFKHQGLGYFRNVIPSGVPGPLLLLVVPIEIISKYFIRPFSLAVRLFANMTAGHVLLAIFAIMTSELVIHHDSGILQIPLGILPFFALVAMTAFEFLVAVLQAYIFTILTAVYVNESLHAEH